MMVNHLMAIVATAGMTSLPKDALDAGAKRAAFVRQLLPISRDSLYLAQYDGYKEALAAHYAKEPQSRKVAKAELVSGCTGRVRVQQYVCVMTDSAHTVTISQSIKQTHSLDLVHYRNSCYARTIILAQSRFKQP